MKRLLAALGIVVVLGTAARCGSEGMTAAPSATVSVTPKPAPSSSTPAAADRAASWPVPISRYTPGGLAKVCTRDVTAATKAEVNMLYGIPPSAKVGEYDHLVPVFVCGSNGPDNIWPEAADGYDPGGFFHNRKDQLELFASGKLSHHVAGWTQAFIVSLFRFPADWRRSWCTYLGPAHPEVDCAGLLP